MIFNISQSSSNLTIKGLTKPRHGQGREGEEKEKDNKPHVPTTTPHHTELGQQPLVVSRSTK